MFLNATMLAGIAGATVPLVLHLLSRARCARIRWGAMMFLDQDESAPRHLRSSRARELLLLLVRMGIVATLAIALARPVLGTGARLSSSGVPEPASVVVLLDRSGSMAFEDAGGRHRMEAARRAALNVLANLRPGDEAALILLPDSTNAPAPQLSGELQSLAQRIDEVRPWSGRADIAAGLNLAAHVLEKSRSTDRRIYIVCDRQAASWNDLSDSAAADWRQRARDARTGLLPGVWIIPIGESNPGNVVVEQVQVVNPPVIRDTPAEVEVLVRNFDTAPRTGLPLVLSEDRHELYRTTLNLTPGAAQTIRCSVAFDTPGSHVITARISSAGLTGDDSLDAAVEVVEPLRVLVISGDEPASATAPASAAASQAPAIFHSEAGFIRLALMPFASSGLEGTDPVRLDVVSAEDWPVLDRQRHQVLILANVARLSEAQARQIEQYAYGGGGVLVAPGNLVRVDDYNDHLWRDGAGLLPAELDSPVAADGSQATALLGVELAHPIFRFLQGRADPVPGVTIGRYFPARVSDPQRRVLARYRSGAPFMVESTYGRGRVLLLTTALDADWSTLPLSNSYLPMLQSAVRYLAGGTIPDRNLWPGQPIIAAIPGSQSTPPRATIEGPGLGSGQPMTVLRVGEGWEARFVNTYRHGRYTVRISQIDTGGEADRRQRTLHFVVRPPRDESNLSSLSPEQWRALNQQIGAELLDSDPAAIAAALQQPRRRTELWPALIAVVLLLAVAELALSRAWIIGSGAEALSRAALVPAPLRSAGRRLHAVHDAEGRA